MENQPVEFSPSSKFIWRIQNFSKLKDGRHDSDIFMAGGCKWRVQIYRGWTSQGHCLGVYLNLAEDSAANSKWLYVVCSLAIINQYDNLNTVKKETQSQLSTGTPTMGFNAFMPLSELDKSVRGYVVNDTCLIQVEISVCRMMKNEKIDASIKVMSSEQSETKQQQAEGNEVVNTVEEKNQVKESEPEPGRQTKLDGKTNAPAMTLQASSVVRPVERSRAGETFGEGRHYHHQGAVPDEKFEDIGGFSILKTQAPLYKQIWLKYGHIASSQSVTASSYITQVWAVKDLMDSIMDMHHCQFIQVSSGLIDMWEEKIKMAEKLEFNIKWLREHFENVKVVFNGMQKFKTALLKQDGQPLWAAKVQVMAAEDELKKALEQLIKKKDEFRANTSPLLSEMEIALHLEKGYSLLFNGMF